MKGTGKELIAQFIHQNSRRVSRTWCRSTAPRSLNRCLNPEMRHRRALYGADRDKPGLLETANGGTLFLDELTEMSLPLQAKLLRVIQDGVVRRVGSENQDAVVDVRLFPPPTASRRTRSTAAFCGATCSTACRSSRSSFPASQAAGGHPASGQPLPHLLLAAPSPDGRPCPS